VAYGGGEVWGVQTPLKKFRRTSKIVPNSTRLWKLLKIAVFRTLTSQDVRKKGGKILKLPPVHNWFSLAMTYKLVVIINILKVPKIKKNITIWNEISCTKLQLPPEPLTRGLPIPDPRSLCPQLTLLKTYEQNSWVRHCVRPHGGTRPPPPSLNGF